MKNTLLFVFALGALVSTGGAVRCYQCIATQCNDPFDASNPGVEEVSYPEDCACLKQTMEFRSIKLTMRNCVDPITFLNGSLVSEVPSIRLSSGISIKSVSASFCYDDLCNGATSISINLSILSVIAAAFVVNS